MLPYAAGTSSGSPQRFFASQHAWCWQNMVRLAFRALPFAPLPSPTTSTVVFQFRNSTASAHSLTMGATFFCSFSSQRS